MFFKKINKQVFLVILLLIVIATSFAVNYNQERIREENKRTEEIIKQQNIIREEIEKKEPSKIESEGGADQELPTETATKGGIYEDYNYDYVDNSITGQVVIFFHASWSPASRNLEGKIRENNQKIPKNLTILKADFDSYKNLASEYGVTRPETFVKINGIRELTKITTDLKNLDEIIEFSK